MKAHYFVGLDAPVYLPDNVTVIIDIVPSWRRNIRSNQPYDDQDRVSIHSTGNRAWNADARSERNYLHSGAGGRYVGYNFAVHVKGGEWLVIQLTPLDEVTWAAGTAEGNRRSWHIEKAVGGQVDIIATNDLAAVLAGALCQAQGLAPLAAVKQHYVWYGKNCPQLVREKPGEWNRMLTIANAQPARIAAFLDGQTEPDPEPLDPWPYADPVPIKSLIEFEHIDQADIDSAPQEVDGITMVFDTYEVVNATPRLRYMWHKAEHTGPNLQPGTRVRIVGLKYIDAESRWYGVTPAPYWTRVRMSDLKRVSDRFDA